MDDRILNEIFRLGLKIYKKNRNFSFSGRKDHNSWDISITIQQLYSISSRKNEYNIYLAEQRQEKFSWSYLTSAILAKFYRNYWIIVQPYDLFQKYIPWYVQTDKGKYMTAFLTKLFCWIRKHLEKTEFLRSSAEKIVILGHFNKDSVVLLHSVRETRI